MVSRIVKCGEPRLGTDMDSIAWMLIQWRMKQWLTGWQGLRMGVGLSALFLLLSATAVHALPGEEEVCEAVQRGPSLINTTEDADDNNVIVIGHFSNHNYVVIIPGRRDDLLEQVRRYVPDAFRSSSRLGSYIHAGAFESRREAETLSKQLRACRIRARVVYFRRGRPI